MRFVKENSTHAEVVRSCLKKQPTLSQQTDDSGTGGKGRSGEDRRPVSARQIFATSLEQHARPRWKAMMSRSREETGKGAAS